MQENQRGCRFSVMRPKARSVHRLPTFLYLVLLLAQPSQLMQPMHQGEN